MTKPLYFYNGTTFELVGPTTPQSPIAYQTSAPTAPATGDLWIDSDGDVDTYNRQLTRYYYVATAGQTSVSGVDANGLTLAYVAGSEQVYVNGALQVRGVDYTATNGTSITGLSALALNDVVEVFAYTAFTVANAYTKSETDSVAAAAAGLRMVVPTSVAVGSGTGSVDAIGNITFSGASSISVNGCFTSTYDNYLLYVTITAVTTATDTDVLFRLRASASDTTSNYSRHIQNWNPTAAAIGTGVSNQNEVYWFSGIGTSNPNSFGEMRLFNPNKASVTSLATNGYGVNNSTSQRTSFGNFQQTGATQFDGFTFYLAGAGTITGKVRVYGYKD